MTKITIDNVEYDITNASDEAKAKFEHYICKRNVNAKK